MNDYHGWQQVLSANPEARLSLNHDDWLFFFGQLSQVFDMNRHGRVPPRTLDSLSSKSSNRL